MDCQKLMDDARRNCEFVPNPQAEEFVPKNTTNTIPIKPRFVYIKTPLVVYQKKEKEVAHLDLTEYGYEEYLLEFSGASFDSKNWPAQMDLTVSGYEEYLLEYSGARFDSKNWPEEAAQMDLTLSGYEEYLPGYSGTGSNNLYWPEEVGQYKQSGKCVA